ncbi:hypothetical protein EK0264_18460 [Epidermidibacterium keratini]|uniref:Uncharacterized protein n=1 Tax=Epidermidibacterium keratini TaxID=1891644 RepID=A0A7L4YTF8_9ACTN|nr:hypothetical protein [Epidermidibacterium keratini]QHC02059.1 hypothetical protein EK0264_18460 [Epidermidibacterium keratini]
MLKARSLTAAVLATLFTAAALAGASWATAAAAAQGYSQAKLPGLLTIGNFTALEWPFRTDRPPFEVHLAFYLAIALAAIVTGLVVVAALRKASPRNGGSAFVATWLGVILGALVAAVAIYLIRVDALAASAADRNGVLAGTVQGLVLGGLLIGWVPGVFAWIGFALSNRKAAAAQQEAIDRADGDAEENPFDLAPGSIGDARPVEPGFTYPSGDEFSDGSYRDTDLPRENNSEATRAAHRMTFTDPTDATGEDIDRHASDYGVDRPKETDDQPTLRQTAS